VKTLGRTPGLQNISPTCPVGWYAASSSSSFSSSSSSSSEVVSVYGVHLSALFKEVSFVRAFGGDNAKAAPPFAKSLGKE